MDARLRKERGKMNTLSSLLNFIGQVIADIKGAEEFTLERNTDISGGEGYGVYDKATNLVRLNFAYNNGTTVIPITTPIFTVPQAYRPSSPKRGNGFVYTTTPVAAGATYSVATNGEITQRATNTGTRGFGYIEYKLGGGNTLSLIHI